MHSKEYLRVLLFTIIFSSSFARAAFADSALTEGIKAFQSKNYTEAARLLSDAEKSDFNDAKLHYYLANSLMKLNRPDEAKKHYKLALDMSNDEKLSGYCQQALDSLSGIVAKSPVQNAASAQKTVPVLPDKKLLVADKDKGSQPPQVYVYLCGCPLCHRIDVMVTALHVEFGDKISFIRVMKNATDTSTANVVSTYKIAECPTVLLFNNQGAMIKRYTGVVQEDLVRKDVIALEGTTDYTHNISTGDEHKIQTRKAIVEELYGRIAADRLRVDNEIEALQKQQAQDDQDALAQGRRVTPGNNRNTADKIQQLDDDLRHRKAEWTSYAKERLRASGIDDSITDVVEAFHPIHD